MVAERQGPVIVVRGGAVLQPTGFTRADVAIAGGEVRAVGQDVSVPRGATVIDAGGCLVGPGLVDLHTHLRQPGAEEVETIETGSRAAALGGYTALVAMPNTEPPVDSAGVAREIMELGRSALAEILVAGAITMGRSGERLAPMAELSRLGVRIFTDDGTGVQDAGVMRRALDYARGLGVVLAQHCEDRQLAAGGVMHEGAWSSRLGLPGVPAAAEETMLARDLALVRLTGSRMHFMHLSTEGSMELVRRAKAEGLPITAEVTPHHLTLTEEAVREYDPVFKVSPPLRRRRDVEALVAAARDKTVDAVATDHAPHAPEAKDLPFDQAPPGMLGLETALAVTCAALGDDVPKEQLFALMSQQPARIAGVGPARRAGGRRAGALPGPGRPVGSAQGGWVQAGAAANLCVFDPHATWVVDPGALASRSRNTPFAGWTLRGRVRHTILRGEPVVIDAQAQR